VVAPLTGLLNKRRKSQWTSECQEAFDDVKMVLTTTPIWATANYAKLFKAAIDGGMGALVLYCYRKMTKG